MVYELLIDNKNGNVWDISDMVGEITWKTTRIGKPGSLEFTLIKNRTNQVEGFQYNNGDVVRFKKDDQNIFYGYVFSIEEGKDESVKIKCYDQIRYLMVDDTYVFANITATQVAKRIADDFNLRTGRLDDTSYRIPTMVEDGKKLIDIINKALDLTLIHSGRNFVLFDDFGALSIRNVEDLLVDVLVGDESLMYDFQHKRSIDDDTYNRVKLVQNNKETGKREVYVAQDSANIAKWGRLQLYQTVDENRNPAQIKELLNQLITLKNREKRKLKIEAIGDAQIRAGCYIPVEIKEYGINQPFLVDECTHRFNGPDHTMSLELKVI